MHLKQNICAEDDRNRPAGRRERGEDVEPGEGSHLEKTGTTWSHICSKAFPNYLQDWSLKELLKLYKEIRWTCVRQDHYIMDLTWPQSHDGTSTAWCQPPTNATIQQLHFNICGHCSKEHGQFKARQIASSFYRHMCSSCVLLKNKPKPLRLWNGIHFHSHKVHPASGPYPPDTALRYKDHMPSVHLRKPLTSYLCSHKITMDVDFTDRRFLYGKFYILKAAICP